jgi:hypothetical protein
MFICRFVLGVMFRVCRFSYHTCGYRSEDATYENTRDNKKLQIWNQTSIDLTFIDII